jgi:hypothetical protein
MSRRLRKQLTYGLLFATFWILVIGGIYFLFLKPAPSCFDNIQNQGEGGIDCGGPCAKVCLPSNLKPLTLADRILILKPDALHISFLTQVSNPNFTYAAKSFSYTFELLDAKGGVVQSFSGSSFIYAGEVKYILLPGLPLPQVPFVDADFKTSDEDWVPAGNFPGPPQFNTAGAQTSVLPKRVRVDGTVTNMEAVIFAKVTIIAVLRGNLGQVAGASETEVENLAPGSPQPFSIIHPPMPTVDVLGTKIFPYAARQ